MRPIRSGFGALLAAAALFEGCGAQDPHCSGALCAFNSQEADLIRSLAALGPPPPDRSNRYVGDACAEDLGQRFFFDTRFSGPATAVDALGRPVPYARAPLGQPLLISCATCHDLTRGGADTTSIPDQISVGAGWSAVNAGHVTNAAYVDLPFWNGRDDSLWALVIPVVESPLAMNSDRLAVGHRIFDVPAYRQEYARVFAGYPLPFIETSTESRARTDPMSKNQECARDAAGACPPPCREVGPPGARRCDLRFPLHGKPGKVHPTCAENPDGCCQPGMGEPFDDAFDCMDKDDRNAVNRVAANFAKAIAAYEYRLTSTSSPFDRAVMGGDRLSDGALRGARLFVGKASCIECHSTPLFSDNRFHNTGAPQVGPDIPTEAECPGHGAPCDCVSPRADLAACGMSAGAPPEKPECLPWGYYDGLRKLRNNETWRRYGKFSDAPDDDSRRKYCDPSGTDESTKGAFRTQTLRDIALTAPYMHDGVFATLDEVVEFYDKGGSSTGASPEHISAKMRPLHLTPGEKKDLVEFLDALTGDPLPGGLIVRPAVPPDSGCMTAN